MNRVGLRRRTDDKDISLLNIQRNNKVISSLLPSTHAADEMGEEEEEAMYEGRATATGHYCHRRGRPHKGSNGLALWQPTISTEASAQPRLLSVGPCGHWAIEVTAA